MTLLRLCHTKTDHSVEVTAARVRSRFKMTGTSSLRAPLAPAGGSSLCLVKYLCTMSFFTAMFPERLDNTYRGRKLALWFFGVVVAIKTLQMVLSLALARNTLRNADGIPLDSYPAGAAATILSLSSLLAFTYLLLCFISIVVLLRYRRAVPLLFAMFLVDYFGRRVIFYFLPISRVGAPPAGTVNLVLLLLMLIGFVLSVWPAKKR